jgi:hypothetical protein
MFNSVDNRLLQSLQENERACNMTVDALETLTGDLRTLAGTAAVELQAIREAMALALPGTPSRQLQRRRFEEKFSEFFARKYALLAEMQARRRQTLAQLESALDRLQRENGAVHRPWREKAREEIRRNNERLAEIRLELAPLLARWKDNGQAAEERSALARRIRALRSEQLALYEANQSRLSAWLDGNGEHDDDLSGVRNALRAMWKNLQSAFAWIDPELAYTRLIVDYRKNWLALTARLLEVSGVVDRFRDTVQRLNGGSSLLLEMEPMLAPPLLAPPDSRPGLKWPEATPQFSPAEADPLEQLIA